ncbi:hypothetical protein Acor_47530 [Acrocarpospora corrugata]|uniref:DUF305 domain-containing protein n=1 Tax=Acrocarpospora corrugata TaxID=35763 RepID=A0A5M3W0P6_9ACTN|nr:hypothetical protein [Acrocarpospora corrugata]GES02687.1 hypothetical protein Acor_47530 [Acrocarpospora corrugata]
MRTRKRLLVATIALIVAGGTTGSALAGADPKAGAAAGPAAKGGPSACSADGLKTGAPEPEPAQPLKKPGGSIAKPGAPDDKPNDMPKDKPEDGSLLFNGPAPDLMAQALGITHDQAVQVAHQIEDLAAANNGIDVGRTSAELRDALNLVKRSLDCSTPSDDKKGDPGQKQDDGHGTEILAAALGVTKDQAEAVRAKVDALSARTNGIDPNGADFAQIAAGVGKTPAELRDALNQVKQAPR